MGAGFCVCPVFGTGRCFFLFLPGPVLVFLLQVIDLTGILENPTRGSGCRQFLIPEAR